MNYFKISLLLSTLLATSLYAMEKGSRASEEAQKPSVFALIKDVANQQREIPEHSALEREVQATSEWLEITSGDSARTAKCLKEFLANSNAVRDSCNRVYREGWAFKHGLGAGGCLLFETIGKPLAGGYLDWVPSYEGFAVLLGAWAALSLERESDRHNSQQVLKVLELVQGEFLAQLNKPKRFKGTEMRSSSEDSSAEVPGDFFDEKAGEGGESTEEEKKEK